MLLIWYKYYAYCTIINIQDDCFTNFQAGTKARSYAEKSLQFDNPENINLKSCGYNKKCPVVLSIYLDQPIYQS